MSKKSTVDTIKTSRKKLRLTKRGKYTIIALLIAAGVTLGGVAAHAITSSNDTVEIEVSPENKKILNKLKIGNKNYYDYEKMFDDLYYQSMLQDVDHAELDKKGQKVLDNETRLYICMCFLDNPDVKNAIENNNGNIDEIEIKYWYETVNGEIKCYIQIENEVIEVKTRELQDIVINGGKAQEGSKSEIPYNPASPQSNLTFEEPKGPHSLTGARKKLEKAIKGTSTIKVKVKKVKVDENGELTTRNIKK